MSGAFEFGPDGMPAVFRAERHRDIGGGRSVLTPFVGRMTDYRPVDGVLVPHRVVGAWIIEGQPIEYARFDLVRRAAPDDSHTSAEEFEIDSALTPLASAMRSSSGAAASLNPRTRRSCSKRPALLTTGQYRCHSRWMRSRRIGRAIRIQSSRGPRWRRRPDERPAALMDAALTLLVRRGYRHVRLAEVAADAGVSKATVYHYFRNKNALLTRSIEGRIAARQARIERKLASRGGSASDRLRFFLQQFWRVSLTPQAGVWQRLLVSEIVADAPGVFAAWARGLINRWDLVAALIREGQQTGEFRSDADADVVARLIVSGLAHQALFHVHFGMRRLAPCRLDRLIDAAVEHLLAGLAADPPTRRQSV